MGTVRETSVCEQVLCGLHRDIVPCLSPKGVCLVTFLLYNKEASTEEGPARCEILAPGLYQNDKTGRKVCSKTENHQRLHGSTTVIQKRDILTTSA